MTARLSQDVEQQIIDLFERGVCKTEIGRRLGCWAGTVLDVLRRNGVDSTPKEEATVRRIMDPIEIAYLAGIIDGEGSIYLNDGKHPQIKVAMCDKEAVNYLYSISSVGIIRENPLPKNEKWSQSWCWEVSRKKDVVRILLAVYPLLKVQGRKSQAVSAMEVL